MRVLVDYAHEGRAYCEYATTLGAGGMFVQTETPLAPGTTIRVRFRIRTSAEPATGPGLADLVEMEARVVWSQLPDEEDATRDPGMGLEFTDKAAVAALARRLEKLA